MRFGSAVLLISFGMLLIMMIFVAMNALKLNKSIQSLNKKINRMMNILNSRE